MEFSKSNLLLKNKLRSKIRRWNYLSRQLQYGYKIKLINNNIIEYVACRNHTAYLYFQSIEISAYRLFETQYPPEDERLFLACGKV